MELVINLEAFKYALSNFGKGEVFETFAQSFLTGVIGADFIPVGGVKDKGVDGFLKAYHRLSHPKIIYQISTEIDIVNKINDTQQVLQKNGIALDQLVYVTSRKINNKDKVEDDFLTTHRTSLKIYDVDWFASNVVYDEKLAVLYHTFIESNIHEFQKPDKLYVVGNFITDPRLYVFLRQHFDASISSLEIEEKLADTLILYALEGTGSEIKVFRSNLAVKHRVAHFVKFNPLTLHDTIDKRLSILSKKPNQLINYHSSVEGYCLPYSTRLALKERDVEELKIFEAFKEQTTELLKRFLKDKDVNTTRILELIEKTIHEIYHKQGIEFSSFVIEGRSTDILEIGLPEIVSQVVDESHVVMKNKTEVKKALLMTIRSITYNGTREQREYLRRMSQTYSMMFMLRWDPQLATSFQKIASQLKIFVDTSILIPALSEIFLDHDKRRYWNLLEGAHQAGVKLTVNQIILDELVSHFGMIRHKYKTQYKAVEELYLEDEISTFYVDEIMIRAYLYSKSRKKVRDFNNFIGEFANPNLNDAHRDLLSFLQDEFRISFEDTSIVEAQIAKDDIDQLTQELTEPKKSKEKALTDAKIMLMIYKMRELNQENKNTNVFGYKTWWLSQDIITYKAVQTVFGDRFNVNCYMRSDFLYNYISLSPRKVEIDHMFKAIFPSMMGINLSFHLPKDICTHINKSLNEHAESSPTRIKRVIRNYTERLMSTPTLNSKKLTSYFDEEMNKALKGEDTQS